MYSYAWVVGVGDPTLPAQKWNAEHVKRCLFTCIIITNKDNSLILKILFFFSDGFKSRDRWLWLLSFSWSPFSLLTGLEIWLHWSCNFSFHSWLAQLRKRKIWGLLFIKDLNTSLRSQQQISHWIHLCKIRF